MTPSALIQIIRVRWDKSARGGQSARNRAGVPSALAIPDDRLLVCAGEIHIEESHFDSRNDFAEPVEHHRHRVPLSAGYRVGCVTVVPCPDGLRVDYRYDRANGGAPDRWFFNENAGYGETPHRTLIVRAGEWVRVCYNGRFSSHETGNWWYQQLTVNVAYFAGEPSGDVFLLAEPTQEFRVMANLW